MDLLEVIKNRRSVRKFSSQPLAQGVLEKIIEAASYAPSHCNTQGWKFIFVDDEYLKKQIHEQGGSYVVKNAPYGILVLYNTLLSDNLEYKDWIQSSAAAIQNMLLTINSLGLGGCWVCHLPRQTALRNIFNIPRSYAPIAYVAFGYTGQPTINIPRKYRVDELLAHNTFTWTKENFKLSIRFKRLLRKIYFLLPGCLKKILIPLVDKFVKKFPN